MDQTAAEHMRPAVIVPHRTAVLIAALIATFIPAVESSIVATAMPTIVGALGGFHLFSWVFAVPLLTMAVTIPIYGRLADIEDGCQTWNSYRVGETERPYAICLRGRSGRVQAPGSAVAQER